MSFVAIRHSAGVASGTYLCWLGENDRVLWSFNWASALVFASSEALETELAARPRVRSQATILDVSSVAKRGTT